MRFKFLQNELKLCGISFTIKKVRKYDIGKVW